MDKSLWGHGALAALCTAAAFTAWTAPTITEKSDAVVMVPGNAASLTSIVWKDDASEVAVTRVGEDVEVSLTKTQPPSPPQVYPGSDQAKELFAKLMPLTAARNLGTLAEDKLKSFGLDHPKNRLTLQSGANSTSVDVGSTVYGSGDFYSRGPDGAVYLLRASSISSLNHGAIALQAREAIGLGRDKFDRVKITMGETVREAMQRHGDDAAKAFFADPAEPERKLPLLSSFMDKALTLRVIDLEAAAPKEAPKLTITLQREQKTVAEVALYATNNDKGAVGTSSRFKTPVLLMRATVENLLHDAQAALADGK